MAQEDADAAEDEYGEQTDSRVDQLLRALSHAPRPAALQLEHAALPEAVTRNFTEERASSPPAPRCGEIVDGRYRIDDTLGAGGMGVVFGATQLATGRKVALKWMQLPGNYRTRSECEQSFQRFLREAQATGRIRHPNVVDVYDAGKDPLTPYLVMERLEGETLRARMDRGPLAWEEALGILLPAMSGVAEAHRSGVVHRDLKPDNVFLSREGDHFVPKVLDFGVSRLRPNDELAAELPSLTRTGTVLGTPAYMPLEQLRAVGIDARTDVYALGVVLYEMLAGKRPYEARNAADFAALLACERPTPLSRYRPDLRGSREAVVMKALARLPDERHADVAGFADALTQAGKERSRGFSVLAACAAFALAASSVWLYQVRGPSHASPERAHRSDAAAPVRTAPLQPPVVVPTPASNPPPSEARSLAAEPVLAAPRRRAPAEAAARGKPAAEGHVAPRPRHPASLEQADFQLPTSSVPASKSPPDRPLPSLKLGRDQF